MPIIKSKLKLLFRNSITTMRASIIFQLTVSIISACLQQNWIISIGAKVQPMYQVHLGQFQKRIKRHLRSSKGWAQHELVVIFNENVFSAGFLRRRLQAFASTSQNVARATRLPHGREFHISLKNIKALIGHWISSTKT